MHEDIDHDLNQDAKHKDSVEQEADAMHENMDHDRALRGHP